MLDESGKTVRMDTATGRGVVGHCLSVPVCAWSVYTLGAVIGTCKRCMWGAEVCLDGPFECVSRAERR